MLTGRKGFQRIGLEGGRDEVLTAHQAFQQQPPPQFVVGVLITGPPGDPLGLADL
jgi:hypothetical protein